MLGSVLYLRQPVSLLDRRKLRKKTVSGIEVVELRQLYHRNICSFPVYVMDLNYIIPSNFFLSCICVCGSCSRVFASRRHVIIKTGRLTRFSGRGVFFGFLARSGHDVSVTRKGHPSRARGTPCTFRHEL